MPSDLTIGLIEYQCVIGSQIVGQKAGLDISRISGDAESYANAGIANGRACSLTSLMNTTVMVSDASAIIADWGATSDFLVLAITRYPSGANPGDPSANIVCGEGNASGWDWSSNANHAGLFFEVPASDESYPFAYSSAISFDVWHMVALRWDFAGKNLSLLIDNGTATDLAVPMGCGAPDTDNQFNVAGYLLDFGILATWIGTVPSVSDAQWFANIISGAAFGRTYAEILATAGPTVAQRIGTGGLSVRT